MGTEPGDLVDDEQKKRHRSYWLAGVGFAGTGALFALGRSWVSGAIFAAAAVGAIGTLWRWWRVDRKLPSGA